MTDKFITSYFLDGRWCIDCIDNISGMRRKLGEGVDGYTDVILSRIGGRVL